MNTPVGVVSKEEALKLSGMDFLQKLKNGDLPRPPFSETMDMIITELSDGFTVFTATPDLKFYNAIGCIHGGYISTLLDSAMACAIQTQLSPGTAFTTLELKVNFIRPVLVKTGAIRAEGKLIHCGRTIATAEGKLYDEQGKLYAFGTTTCALMPIGVPTNGSGE
ncbi:PaaI family thioesterase [Candidatus Paracaedibacter symbiosus]|uniref:PaaI family thioesterase n=1 Tax=Candidatus Paracaedibacter symbiosus TaxID=244582 RepID=UPI000690F495|nr:PaaI family thioesterase [Candidatus Paracaedibacter symbiosus]